MDEEEAAKWIHVAGNGNFDQMDKTTSGAGYSRTFGSVVQGKRMQVRMRLKQKGTGSRLHTHKKEQLNCIVKGALRVKIGSGNEVMARAGTLIDVPANVPHTMVAATEEDVLYFVCKGMSDHIFGRRLTVLNVVRTMSLDSKWW